MSCKDNDFSAAIMVVVKKRRETFLFLYMNRNLYKHRLIIRYRIYTQA